MKLNIAVEIDCDPNDELDDEELADAEVQVIDHIRDTLEPFATIIETDNGIVYQYVSSHILREAEDVEEV